MSQSSNTILVASDSMLEAEQVRNLLRETFEGVVISVLPERYVSDFEQHKPSVLVLAFKEVERAESYYLGIYRRSRLAPALPHRTLILCHKNEVKRCYELCCKKYFDDYVLFWPMAYDGFRLLMSVMLAQRALERRPDEAPIRTSAYEGPFMRLQDRSSLPLAGQESVEGPTGRQLLAMPAAGARKPEVFATDAAVEEKPPKTILIVDDDSFQCKLISRLLADLDCELCFLGTGEEVMAWLSTTKPCLILMDIRLPGINGVEVTHQLKSTPALAQIPVIMITGNSDRMAVAKSLKVGAIDFVVKPFNREVLRKKVERFLD